MMNGDRLQKLYETNEITPYQYETFLLYEVNDLGKRYLAKMIDQVFFHEESSVPTDEGHSFYAGRQSVYRDKKQAIWAVYEKLNKMK